MYREYDCITHKSFNYKLAQYYGFTMDLTSKPYFVLQEEELINACQDRLGRSYDECSEQFNTGYTIDEEVISNFHFKKVKKMGFKLQPQNLLRWLGSMGIVVFVMLNCLNTWPVVILTQTTRFWLDNIEWSYGLCIGCLLYTSPSPRDRG